MSGLRFCLLLAVICSCSQYGLAASQTAPKTVLIDVPQLQQEKVLEVLKEATTIAPPASTASPSTSSSTEPSTSSSTEPSTSPEPETTTKTTTEITPPPPPPSPSPAPTPAPGPLPPPDQGTWAYTDPKSNVTCIVAQFAAKLNVTYTKVVENATSLWYVLLNVPANSSVTGGNCSDPDQWIQVSWLNSNTSTQANNMTLVYHRNETTKNYGLKSLNISLSPENFVNSSSKDPLELYHGAEWQTPLATSYRCKTATLLNMTSESPSAAAVLTLSRLQEEAYRTTNGSGFSAARECGGGDVPDAVPIAVGCALGGLVVVVLVAYLVGRRRSAARGYLSM